ncbi:uncharacterized protein GGS25DRAFT_469259 [Hypoxylon fragiforme]|uniref:uncharacterized protein n=1 Tax=Hypoxylon fragiforme TaxID=63214 RepID=UPI0020C5FC5D|nr:uncharacterized protein GGS25DRAFT_469259 [Hypoxylon fragiforme]KAI2613854.1 hypothetical protein GGS25DRAFT_469259 [Hypoxylon fragiforme]
MPTYLPTYRSSPVDRAIYLDLTTVTEGFHGPSNFKGVTQQKGEEDCYLISIIHYMNTRWRALIDHLVCTPTYLYIYIQDNKIRKKQRKRYNTTSTDPPSREYPIRSEIKPSSKKTGGCLVDWAAVRDSMWDRLRLVVSKYVPEDCVHGDTISTPHMPSLPHGRGLDLSICSKLFGIASQPASQPSCSRLFRRSKIPTYLHM